MSFVRALVAAGPSARLAAGRVTASHITLAYRWHSTAPRDPLLNTQPKDRLDVEAPIRSPGVKTYSAADEVGKDYDPYKDGPSAIDKAVHLFFFTEIIRGPYAHACSVKQFLNLATRHVDSHGTVLPATVHYHVPLREGPSVAALPRRACPSQIPKR